MALPASSASWRQLLPKDYKQPKGFLTKFFDFLDLPKNVVQNLMKGNLGGSVRNIADIATGITGLRLLPGLNEALEASREEDRPTMGLIRLSSAPTETRTSAQKNLGASILTVARRTSATAGRAISRLRDNPERIRSP